MNQTDDHIWGAKAISRETGLSTYVVYQMAGRPDTPIIRPAGSGRLYASRSDLRCWLRKKPKLPDES